MKTKPMSQQIEALQRLNGKRNYALLMEMGTGKTWTILADAERAYTAGKIDALLVIAPKGVHTNWILREVPTHLDCSYVAAAYHSGANKRQQRQVEKLFTPRQPGEIPPLRILAMNIDAINHKSGRDMAERFLLVTKAMMVIDESDRIKGEKSGRTKAAIELGRKAVARRICSGAPILNAPADIFMQMEFLRPGLLGTSSYRAFVAEYAHLLPPTSNLIKHIREKQAQQGKRFIPEPQIVAKDSSGRPRWRNLDKLSELLEPHSYRVLKKDCLDLPPKIYTQTLFELTPAQRRIYDTLQEKLRIELDGETLTVKKLAALMKLQQVTAGFVMLEGESRLLQISENPRMDVLREAIGSIHGQFIVWARFREELRQIAELMDDLGIPCVEYHGGVSTADREIAVNSFQAGQATAFLGQAQSGGIGLTLTAAEDVIYYSQDFNLGTRLQSEDRCHRIGTKSNVTYNDLCAIDTVDEGITRALQRKEQTASLILDNRSVPFPLSSGEN